MTTLTVIVPAYNEEEGLPDTLEALLRQSELPDRIIVADDFSSDSTALVAASYAGVEVVTPPHNLGSKARAQNYALQFVDTDLVLPVDADTVLADDYIELIKKPFADDRVAIAAGCVLTKKTKTITERGRSLEYMFGFHFYRPIQNMADSPMVCSGCCSAFRVDLLKEFGGFPERTIVEDMDYTWSQQIAGYKAVYVSEALCFAADPETFTYMRKQLWRWLSGFFQNVRLHSFDLIKHKKMLAMWVGLAVLEIMTVPLWYLTPFILTMVFGVSLGSVLFWFLGVETFILMMPITYACFKRDQSVLQAILSIPSLYIVKVLNFYYAWKAMINEMILVPLGVSEGLHDYEKGRA